MGVVELLVLEGLPEKNPFFNLERSNLGIHPVLTVKLAYLHV